jgi:hypothetical protein
VKGRSPSSLNNGSPRTVLGRLDALEQRLGPAPEPISVADYLPQDDVERLAVILDRVPDVPPGESAGLSALSHAECALLDEFLDRLGDVAPATTRPGAKIVYPVLSDPENES